MSSYDDSGIDEEAATHSHARAWLAALTVILALAVLGLGWLLWQSSRRMERRMAQLEQRVAEGEKNSEHTAELASSAEAQAFQSEESARAAAAGRTVAEQARAAAEDAKSQAVQQADQARQTAATATEEARAARTEADQIRQRREAEIERLQKALGRIADTQRTPLGLLMTLGSDSIRSFNGGYHGAKSDEAPDAKFDLRVKRHGHEERSRHPS